MTPALRTLLTLLVLSNFHASAAALQETPHPAFTLRSRVTTRAPDGTPVVLDRVRYVASDGSYHVVETKQDGSVSNEFFYERGRGLLRANHSLRMLVRLKKMPPEDSDTKPRTADELRASPDFLRTEEVLGRTAYVIRYKNGETGLPLADYYYAPELGGIPLKSVRYNSRTGEVLAVTEPVSVEFGEPEAALLKAPDYEMSDTGPISGGVLNGKAVEKPTPDYPVIANTAERPEGVVVVQVMVDEAGKVVSAKAVSGHPLLRQAAVEAALKARFSPTLLSGKPVKVTGTLSYNFKRE